MKLDTYNKGFTVIELLVVFSIMAILAVISIASFSPFNDTQASNVAVSDVVNTINTAKSNAISQVKPTQCQSQTLKGYEVVISLPNQYEFDVLCDNSIYLIGTKMNLPKNVTFTNKPIIMFNVSTGTVVQPATINLTGNGINKQIIINATGIISILP
jgi:prepilin-type N-terminal cleavage/methylation domain-containing protein